LRPGRNGVAMGPEFVMWLAEAEGVSPGIQDLVLVAPGSPVQDEGPTLVRDEALLQTSRGQRALRHRTDIRFADEDRRAVIVLGRGLADRWEIGIEVDAASRSRRLGRRLLRAARTLVPASEPLYAQVAPGNAAVLRVFLAAGFQPLCSEILFFS
jgi:hypothetical protein